MKKNKRCSCGALIWSVSKKCRSCSKKGLFKEKNANWRGGRFVANRGYVIVCCPGHPYPLEGNYVIEHRLVMEKHIGRYLKPEEEVHHINEIKTDNRLSNLMLFPNKAAHIRFHAQQRKKTRCLN